jgi:hypothetical protein
MEKDILTEKQILHIINNELLDECDSWEQDQVLTFVFGEDNGKYYYNPNLWNTNK